MTSDTSREPEPRDDDEDDDDDAEDGGHATPFAPKKDGTALGDTSEHSDADA